jgi:23S rRNA (uracil1939-C5)-methyltransferase
VHVNFGQTDGNGAALVRREVDRLIAAGVVGVLLGGKPLSGLPEVNVAERGGAPLPVPAGAFAQVGRAGNRVLVDRVLEAVGRAPGTVLELYAGSGNFTRELVALAAPAPVHACEGDPAAVARGLRAAPGAAWSARVPDIVTDVVVLDPPREGADGAHLAAALRARRRIVYLSCDPQTLSRDARRIAGAGFRLARALAIDLMPQTFHVEVLAVFDRS